MLEITNVINISVAEAPQGLGEFNVNNVGLFTNEEPIEEWDDDWRAYVAASEVGADFGTDSETYKQAVAFFSQAPNVLNGGGQLIIFPVNTATDGVIESFTIAATGSGYDVDDVLTVGGAGTGGTLKVTAVDGAGRVLTAELLTGGADYVVASAIATTVAPSGGTGCTINVTAVEDHESLQDALERVQDLVFFVGFISTFLPATSDDQIALSNAVEAMTDKMWVFPQNDTSAIAGIFTAIKAASNRNTRCLIYTTSALDSRLFAAAYAGRGFSTNFDQAGATETMNLKQLTTIEPDEGITQTLWDACKTAGVDAYVSYGGRSSVVSNGANQFFDQAYNLIWLVTQLQVAGFNALAQTSTKVPQTEPGVSILKGAYRDVCEAGLNNAYIAPGKWTSSETFGNQADFLANIAQRGYYIYSTPVADQSKEDREDRKAPVIRIAIKEAGAIQSSNVIVNVNP